MHHKQLVKRFFLLFALTGCALAVLATAVHAQAPEFEVTPSVIGNGVIDPSVPQYVTNNKTVTFTMIPAENNLFVSVSGTCPQGTATDNGDGTYQYVTGGIKSDCTVIAHFALSTYTVNSSVSGGNGTIAPAGDQTVDYGATPSFTLTPDTGYHIDSVTGTCGGTLTDNTFTTDPVMADCTVIANFAVNTYTVNSSVSDGNGTIDPAGDQTVDYGATPSFTLTPNTGYHIDSVTGTCGGTLTGNTFTADPVMADCTVIANFAVDRFTLTVTRAGKGAGTVTSSPEGIDCGEDCAEDFDYGTEVTLTALPGDGSTFTGWSGDGCTGTEDCVVIMDQAREITATFKGGFPWPIFLPATEGKSQP